MVLFSKSVQPELMWSSTLAKSSLERWKSQSQVFCSCQQSLTNAIKMRNSTTFKLPSNLPNWQLLMHNLLIPFLASHLFELMTILHKNRTVFSDGCVQSRTSGKESADYHHARVSIQAVEYFYVGCSSDPICNNKQHYHLSGLRKTIIL